MIVVNINYVPKRNTFAIVVPKQAYIFQFHFHDQDPKYNQPDSAIFF